MKSFYGLKKDQTHVYNKDGKRLFITRLVVNPLKIVQVKTTDKEQYNALQVSIGTKKRNTKAIVGHVKDLNLNPLHLKEINLEQTLDKKRGDEVKVSEVFKVGDEIQVHSRSKGKGFAGAMKRWNFKGGPKTHGQSDRARAVGSIGQGTSPGRIWKGKRMPGHMGDAIACVRGSVVVKIDEAQNELWITGSVPGTRNNLVRLTKVGETKFAGLDKRYEKQESSIENKEAEVDIKQEANQEVKPEIKEEEQK
ncbi:50S ribosomal protein L3 [Candidatus Beckwithbacteria bacterium]|nr:50S ribosomal protein L3 [Candidatus Beckwithbacteria bacterium]